MKRQDKKFQGSPLHSLRIRPKSPFNTAAAVQRRVIKLATQRPTVESEDEKAIQMKGGKTSLTLSQPNQISCCTRRVILEKPPVSVREGKLVEGEMKNGKLCLSLLFHETGDGKSCLINQKCFSIIFFGQQRRGWGTRAGHKTFCSFSLESKLFD